MAELFQRDKSTISRHINKIFKEGELVREATVAFFATVQIEGERKVERDIEYFNLDVIISVGYRVKSKRGTQFRIWANSVLKEYIIKGFAMDDERLKGNAGGNYWKELLDRIRDIVHRKRSYIGRFWIFMQPAWITILKVTSQSNSSKLFRINYTMQHMVIQQLK